jgi:hypothetical protein
VVMKIRVDRYEEMQFIKVRRGAVQMEDFSPC